MKKSLAIITALGWEFSLHYWQSGGIFEIALCRPEWVTPDIYQAREMPTFRDRDPEDAVNAALKWILEEAA